MALFEKAVETVLEHEGGYSNDPLDYGSATNFGISLRFYLTIQPDADISKIKNLTENEAKDIYANYFWFPNKLNLIASQQIATKVLDLCVNMGAHNAIKCLQRAANATGKNLEEDGVVGTLTLAAVNLGDWPQILVGLRCEAAGYYRELVAKIPMQKKFLNGWLKRAYS